MKDHGEPQSFARIKDLISMHRGALVNILVYLNKLANIFKPLDRFLFFFLQMRASHYSGYCLQVSYFRAQQ